MGQLREKMEEDLTLAGYSPSTKHIYSIYANQFAKYHMRSPANMDEDDIREFLLCKVVQQKISCETYKQIRASLRFLYRVTLKRPAEIEHIPVQRKKVKLPVILTGQEVTSLLNAVESQKYRMLIMVQYASGLRISEACTLKEGDIDSKRMVIHVRLGKGGYDRYTVLSREFLYELREYYRRFRPKRFLFPRKTKTGHISPASARRVFRKACLKANITKRVTPHTLRHYIPFLTMSCNCTSA